jgi:serine/threonine protein kinase
MTRLQVVRKPPRKRNVEFAFFLKDQPAVVNLKPEDASICAARFQLDVLPSLPTVERAQIAFGPTKADLTQLEVLEREESCLLRYRIRQLPDGHLLDGNRATYEILNFMAAGQSAETYRARICKVKEGDLIAGDPVVIKVPLFIPFLNDAQLTEMASDLNALFTYEEATLGRLRGLECVARHLDSGSYPLPRPPGTTTKFIVQQLIEGQRLDHYLCNQFGNGNPARFKGLPAPAFCRLARQLAVSVRDIHSNLVIHGDIWPENILVRDSDERPVLIDFGQAVFRVAVGRVSDISGRNEAYVAPERTRSVAGDVYSLGGVLHYLATGEPPPSPIEDIEKLKRKIVENISGCNPDLYGNFRGVADIVAGCLRRNDPPKLHELAEKRRVGQQPPAAPVPSLEPMRRRAHAQFVMDDLDIFCEDFTSVHGEDADAEIARASDAVRSVENPLFRRMAIRDLSALAMLAREMSRGVYDLAGDHEAITAGLTHYVGMLREKDEYLTITVPMFWWPHNLGANGRFLAMNATAAQRGATVRRVFIVAPPDYNHQDFDLVMQSQVQICLEMRTRQVKGVYEVRVHDVAEAQLEQMLKQKDHFGLLVKGGAEIVVYPEYRADGSLSVVKFLADQNMADRLRARFEDYWALGVPVEQWWERHVAGSPAT